MDDPNLPRLAASAAPAAEALRVLTASSRVLAGVFAGVALCRNGTLHPLPGLRGDRLLVEGSPVLALACAHLADGRAFSSFLWPREQPGGVDGHVGVTALASPPQAPAGLVGAVVLAPPPDALGLTPRELEVLGLVIEGLSNQQIAHRLVVAARTAATHVENILTKLDAPTRTLAAVRAERRGLYVPSSPDG